MRIINKVFFQLEIVIHKVYNDFFQGQFSVMTLMLGPADDKINASYQLQKCIL